jgi:hypothetical protein
MIKKNTETLLGCSEEVSVEVNSEKSKYLFLSQHQNAAQNNNIKTGSKS